MHVKQDMLFFKKKQKKQDGKKKQMFFMVQKAKEKLLSENCKCYFKKEKIVLKSLFF